MARQLTRSNIAYNLEVSPHEFEVEYKDGETLTFIFSSELYMNKFFDQIEDNRQRISKSLSKRFDFKIENDKLSDIRLYTLIEKRGFLIKKKDVVFKCLEDITLSGQTLMLRN